MTYYIFYSEKNVIGRTFAYQSLKISLALGMLSKTSTTNFTQSQASRNLSFLSVLVVMCSYLQNHFFFIFQDCMFYFSL